jgi:SAM-dependent methyltransferase
VEPVERFDPEQMQGRLLEAEHVARYRWAAALVTDKRVLDAGCGTGYGSELLAREGATEVVGIDVDVDTVDAAQRASTGKTAFVAADLLALPAELGDFDVVVCFEVLEHLDDPEVALNRLAAVLRPGGVLAVSSPNRDVYPPGNPFHLHEFTPDELATALAARFAHVRLVRQQDWLASGLFDDAGFANVEAVSAPVAKTAPGEPGAELYSVGLAGNSPLPPVPPLVMLTGTLDLEWWQNLLRGLREELAATRKDVVATRKDVAARKQHAEELERWLESKDDELSAAHAEIRAMKGTRLWRTGTRYWRLRDRLLRRSNRAG